MNMIVRGSTSMSERLPHVPGVLLLILLIPGSSGLLPLPVYCYSIPACATMTDARGALLVAHRPSFPNTLFATRLVSLSSKGSQDYSS